MVDGNGGQKGDLGPFYYVPQSWKFKAANTSLKYLNSLSAVTFDTSNAKANFTHREQSPTRIVGTFINNRKVGVDGTTFGNPGAPKGCKDTTPGPFGYVIDGTGIDNGALLEFGNNFPSIDTSDSTIHKAWVCFGPLSSMPAFGGTAWMLYKATVTRDQLDTADCPDGWNKQTSGEAPEWGLGIERLNIHTGGQWGTLGPVEFNNVSADDPTAIGAELVAVQPQGERNAVANTEQDYQLKVLYEYGNCQYNFSQNATPTRVLPNVVPVGPSPGIPAPL